MIPTIPNAVSSLAGDSVFELRRYALKRGQRATLVALFDAEFVEARRRAATFRTGQSRVLRP